MLTRPDVVGDPFALLALLGVDLVTVGCVVAINGRPRTLTALALTTRVDVGVFFGELMAIDTNLLERVPKWMPKRAAWESASNVLSTGRRLQMLGIYASPMDAITV